MEEPWGGRGFGIQFLSFGFIASRASTLSVPGFGARGFRVLHAMLEVSLKLEYTTRNSCTVVLFL